MKYLSIFLFFISIIYSRVLIITHSYNRPDFIELQYKTFKKFLKDDYEFVVFNDAQYDDLSHKIHQTCQKCHIRCIRIPQEIHTRPYLKRWPSESLVNPCTRCANVVQYSLNELGFQHPGIVMIIDSDMFLVKEFSVIQFMENYDLAGHYQDREGKHYLWNGLVFFNMNNLPDKEAIDFNCGKLDTTAVDVGGQTYHYLKAHPELRIHYFNQAYIHDHKLRWISRPYEIDFFQLPPKKKQMPEVLHHMLIFKEIKFDNHQVKLLVDGIDNVEFFLDNTFFHYRSGTNWDNKSAEYHTKKTRLVTKYLKSILGEVICEHSALHASMNLKGKDKI